MSSGMFRGKESSNRIELSRLVQDLLNFGVLGSLQVWGLVYGDGGCPTHTCTHTCTQTHAHAHMVNMIISCKWPPPWGNPWEFPMMSYAHARAYACARVGGTLSPPPTHIHPPPTPRGASPESIKIQ